MSIAGLLNQSVTIYRVSGKDHYGKPTWGSGVAYAARVEQSNKMTFAAPIGLMPGSAELTPIDARIFLPPTALVTAGDKLTAPAVDDANTTVSYRVIKKAVQVDGYSNISHIELGVQKWQV